MLRPCFFVATSVDVATTSKCRDFDVQSLENLMSRLLFCVTTSMSTARPSILSRPRNGVATSCLALH